MSSPAGSPTPREVAVAAARAGGEILREHFGTVLDVRYKGEIDVVTEVDEAAEATIVSMIREAFPTHRILAEEGSTGGDDPSHLWIIDPLDGTTNYSHGMPQFSVSIAYQQDGVIEAGIIYEPSLDELYVAVKGAGATLNGKPIHVSVVEILRRALVATGFPYERERLPLALRQFGLFAERAQAVRRIGSAALDLAYVAAGRFDAYWETVIQPWDIAAGLLLVEEAGGRVTTTSGGPMDLADGELNIVATNGRLHTIVLETLAS